ncbi:electron transport complex subunit RnfE [Lachnospiraceae bacterium]|nr:electron transport complex subunit RnfE [Lachnospiraceae bacterium]
MSSDKNGEAKQSSIDVFFNGLVKENPTFVLVLGMCPTLAVTTSAINGLGMGLTTTAVLVLSNAIISLLRYIIPNRVRIPAFIVIVASFVTMIQLLLEGFIPSLNAALGLYIPLIVVNCIILGRAESFASKNPVIPSIFDGLGMGLGFTVALTAIGMVREFLGAGEIFGVPVINNVLGSISSLMGRQKPIEYVPISIFVLAPGAFFVLAALTALQNRVKRKMQEKGQNVDKIQSGCSSDCASCSDSECSHHFIDVNGASGSVADAKNNSKDV